MTKLELNVGYSELVDKIAFKDETTYVDKNGNLYPSNTIYTYSKISQDSLVENLGEDGYINVYNGSGEQITTLNKDNLEYAYEKEVSGLIFETSKPIKEGTIEIENGRAVKPLEYSKAQEEIYAALKVNLEASVVKNENVAIRTKEAKDITLENPKTQGTIELSETNLSTVVKNEGIEIRVTLKTTDASTALYKNPTLEIILPSYITNIDVENVKLMYEKELKILNAQKGRNENGNIVIKITLEGEQTSYNEEWVTEGATLIMNSDITVNALTPTRKEQILLNITNENTEGAVEAKADINFVAPAGIETVSQIENYRNEGEIAVALGGALGVGEIAVKAPAKVATVKLAAINNYPYNAEKVVILGRTPYVGNKSVVTKKDLGSTFTAKVLSEIKAETGIAEDQMTVYYSSNGEANTNLTDINNTWVTDIRLLDEVKSYMIVLDNYTFNTGNVLGFSYTVEIPANLERNQNTFGTFALYYEKEEMPTSKTNGETGERRVALQSVESGTVGITTGAGPNIKVELKSGLGEDTPVTTRKVTDLTVNVKNDGILPAKDVAVKIELPRNMNYDIYKKESKAYKTEEETSNISLLIPEIPAGESKDVELKLSVNPYDELDIKEYGKQEGNVGIKAEASVAGYEDKFTSNETSYDIRTENRDDAQIEMKVSAVPNRVASGDTVQYEVAVSHNLTDKLNNVNIKCKIPDGLSFDHADDDANYDEANNVLTWHFDKLSTESLVIFAKVNDLKEGIYEKDIPLILSATCDESREEFTSEPCKVEVRDSAYSISQVSNISNGEIKAGQEVMYAITVTNIGAKKTSFTVVDTFPRQLEFVRCTYSEYGETKTIEENDGDSVVITPALEVGETTTIYLTLRANEVNKTMEITNRVKLHSTEIGEIEAEALTLTLIGTKDNNQGGDDKPEESKPSYRISGTAWVDVNKNGKRDDKEEFLSKVKVYLLNSTNKKIVKETMTNDNGVYRFLDVEQGTYLVAFEYDTGKYDLAPYQADDIDESVNSDVIKMDLKLNGEKRSYAVTNTVILNKNTDNIDLGLINDPKFDLELTKGINLVQVSNSQGTKSYQYDHADIAKVEIPEKYMNGSVIAITYTFRVKNTGAISGYVNRIVDYKSKDLNFSSTLNPEWYQETDGSIYNTTLNGMEIKPGETVELSLILTKTMTNENTGISNNLAEITEATNDLGLSDVDSVPGNRNTSEDDLGGADIIVAIKTGGPLFYGGIVLIVLAMFAFGAYEINKRVLRKI